MLYRRKHCLWYLKIFIDKFSQKPSSQFHALHKNDFQFNHKSCIINKFTSAFMPANFCLLRKWFMHQPPKPCRTCYLRLLPNWLAYRWLVNTCKARLRFIGKVTKRSASWHFKLRVTGPIPSTAGQLTQLEAVYWQPLY